MSASAVELTFNPIPVNQYQRTLSDELDRYAREDLLRIHRDMAIIRAFETMLNEVKQQREYKGIPYDHRGPAHLSIGQEASAVGQAFLLSADDHIFGSHRSPMAKSSLKALSSIEKLPEDALTKIMEGYNDGLTLKAVESSLTDHRPQTTDHRNTPIKDLERLTSFSTVRSRRNLRARGRV